MNKTFKRYLIAGFWMFVTMLILMIVLKVLAAFGWLDYENWEFLPLVMGGVSFGENLERLKSRD